MLMSAGSSKGSVWHCTWNLALLPLDGVVLIRMDSISLLVIDHKIDFITTLVDRVIVLELGNLVAEGDPRTIWQDQRVQNAYLGVADDEEVA